MTMHIFMHSYYHLYTYSSIMSPCPRVLPFKKLSCPMSVSVRTRVRVRAS